jgi:hypothetical protein
LNIKNIFKLGKKGETQSASITKVNFIGKTGQPAVMVLPYGMFANPPEGVLVALLADQGNEESLCAFPFDKKNTEDLDDTEVAFGIPSGANRVYFYSDNSIKIVNENGFIKMSEDGTVNINDNFTVDP